MKAQPGTQCENLSYEQFFRRHYESIRYWSLQITDYNRELSEDILHDIYLRFHERRYPAQIENVNAYLYVALRNAYLSHRRKKQLQVSLVELEFADNPPLAIDPRRRIKIHDQLRAVCRYACFRKTTSISGSVLILRFFHGYYSGEVARLIKRSRNAVEARLLTARREVRLYLEDAFSFPESFEKNIFKNRQPKKNGGFELLSELREMIFSTRRGRCPSVFELEALYRGGDKCVTRELLSHFVSCESCLNRINGLLSMPLLGERHPLDTFGRAEIEAPGKVALKAARAAA